MTLDLSVIHETMRIESGLQAGQLERTRRVREAAHPRSGSAALASTIVDRMSTASRRLGNRLAHPVTHAAQVASRPAIAGAVPGTPELPD
jgi:uncharacterized protein YciW